MIIIVYHCFLINEWKNLIQEQLDRLILSGLYDKCDEIWNTVTLLDVTEDEYKEFVKKYTKLKFVFGVQNSAEYLGIKKVKEIGNLYDDAKILYFHTKGVSNTYDNVIDRNYCKQKVENIKAWRECLEYYLIDKWKESLDNLKNNDCVGVTNVHGWYWGNFWWANSNYIKRCREVEHWGRWDYEAWLNNYVEGEKKFFQWYNFQYNPYLTNLYEEWYKNKKTNKKIVLKNAYYGTAPFAIDEGYGDYEINKLIEVTKYVDDELKKFDYKKFEFHASSFGVEDPAPNKRKFLFINFSTEDNLEKEYKIGIGEGYFLNFEL